jgi:hypothetical protein
MQNPSAFGVSLLVLVTATLVVGTSEANENRTFQPVHPALQSAVADFNVQDLLRTYQESPNVISLDRDTLDVPHWLTVSVPVDTDFQGEIVINHAIRLPLANDSTRINLSPYLLGAETTVEISGRYQKDATPIAIIFDGPNTLMEQQTDGTGKLDYQLRLVID